MSFITSVKGIAAHPLGRTTLLAKKYSPEILTTMGVVGFGLAIGLTIKATLKFSDRIMEFEENMDHARHMADNADTKREYNLQLVKGHTKNALAVTRIYGPAFSVGLLSVGCVLGAHGVMRQRNVALAAAYSALDKSFTKYRERIAADLGIDQERDIARAAEEKEVEEDGKKSVVKNVDPTGISAYGRFFDELNPNWDKTPEHNHLFLKSQQNYANDLLRSRGHLFLNEVYSMIGLPHTQAGSVVGWVISKDGDNFVDFGMYDPNNLKAREFVNGYEHSILLDFNVDGVIYDKI